LFVGKSVDNNKKILLPMDLQTGKARQKNLPASFRWYFPQVVCRITDKNTVCNFVGDYLKTF
jgi:hypothetical protein